MHKDDTSPSILSTPPADSTPAADSFANDLTKGKLPALPPLTTATTKPMQSVSFTDRAKTGTNGPTAKPIQVMLF